MRGGLILVVGVLTGNLLGFGRVAVTAYLLGTHSRADSLAVAIGPLDTLNSRADQQRGVRLRAHAHGLRRGRSARRCFASCDSCLIGLFSAIAAAVILAAPWLMRVLAPGLDPAYFAAAVTNLRILSLSTIAAGTAAVHCALLYTDRRFAPTAFYQAALNVFTIGALWRCGACWACMRFAIGYTAGACAQLGHRVDRLALQGWQRQQAR